MSPLNGRGLFFLIVGGLYENAMRFVATVRPMSEVPIGSTQEEHIGMDTADSGVSLTAPFT